MGMMENILMRKCSMNYKQAKKIAVEARGNLDMSTQSLLWSRELEVECFRIVDAAKEAKNAKIEASFEEVKPTIIRRTIGGNDETDLSFSETESDRPQTPPPRRELVREPLSASSLRHKRGKSAGRAAGRRLLLSPQKRRSTATMAGKSSDALDMSTGERAEAPLQATESSASLSSVLLRGKISRRTSTSDDNSSLLNGGSQDSVCSGDSTSRFRRTKRASDGRRPSISRLKLRQNSSENKENNYQDDILSNSIDHTHTASESVATTGSSAKKEKKKKKLKPRAFGSFASDDTLEPAPAAKKTTTKKKKKKKDKSLEDSNNTAKSADSAECSTPRTSRNLQKHLVASSPTSCSDDVKKKKKKKKDRTLEESNHTTKSASSEESKSLGDENMMSRQPSRKKSTTSTKLKPMLGAPSSLMENGNFAISQDVIDAFADCDSSARRNSRLHVKLKKSPKKRPKEALSKPEKFQLESTDRQQDSSRSLLSAASNASTKTRMLPVLRASPKSPTKETREKFTRPIKSCGTGSRLKYQRRPSDSGIQKNSFPSSPTKIQERYASFVANNCDSPESFLSIDDSFSASQCSDFFTSPESASSQALPCFPSLSPNMIDSSLSSLAAPRQPKRQTSDMGDFLG